MTIIEKILARRGGAARVSPGDLVVVDVDAAVLIDQSFHPGGWRTLRKVADPDKVIVILDHGAPAPDRKIAAAHIVARDFVGRFGISRFHDIGRDTGISHVVIAERGYALPGTVLICGDSHTCSSGAFNCAARGVGGPDMIYAVTTGKTWFRLGHTIRYDLSGKLGAGVAAKDIFLHVAGRYGAHTNQNVEFGGDALAHLNINARRTISTMGAELSAEFATFEADDLLLDYLRQRTTAPFEPQYPDKDASYQDRRSIELAAIEPMIALPDTVINNAVPVTQVPGERIHQAFIGSCANGTLDDIAEAAQLLAGRKVASGVRLIVTPGSQEIYRTALKAGYVETLMEAGAIVTNSTCGACSAIHMGVLGPKEVCITSSTRNFKGRMGDPSAQIFMASSATVAASAIAGVVTHPGEFTAKATL
jgi:3-isopropylmalate/(R)-2-methylmalate dehydratase large subunit